MCVGLPRPGYSSFLRARSIVKMSNTFRDIVLTTFGTHGQTHEQPENIMPPATIRWRRPPDANSDCIEPTRLESLWPEQLNFRKIMQNKKNRMKLTAVLNLSMLHYSSTRLHRNECNLLCSIVAWQSMLFSSCFWFICVYVIRVMNVSCLVNVCVECEYNITS